MLMMDMLFLSGVALTGRVRTEAIAKLYRVLNVSSDGLLNGGDWGDLSRYAKEVPLTQAQAAATGRRIGTYRPIWGRFDLA
jgi:hypothetical protein